MKIIKAFGQNTPDWHAWRGKGIGASDAPTVMGDSPWCTPFRLWLEKTNQIEREEPNVYALAAMQRGVALEPEARQWYITRTGVEMEALSAEHDAHPFIRASLDGANLRWNKGIEIKCPGKTVYNKILKTREVPKNYVAQVQQQLLVTGFESIDFVVYAGADKENLIIPVLPDPEYQGTLLLALVKFWECVEWGEAPPIKEEDYVTIQNMLTKHIDAMQKVGKLVNMLFASKHTKEKK